MAQTFNATYSGTAVTLGSYSSSADTYSASGQFSTSSYVKLTGTVASVGNTVTATYNYSGTTGTTTATYEGYYVYNGSTYYVFYSPSILDAIAISSTGAAVPVVTSEKLTTGSIPCFLRGTHITTPDGEALVEDLQIGDRVATFQDGRIVFRPVTWIGGSSMKIVRLADIDDFPMRVRAGAFRDNVPHRDLLVTSEHCIFTHNVLIPARMLVNGQSIVVETDVTQYEYFHIELEQHAILLAEGLEAESYLDTGNRGNFADAEIPNLHPDFTIHSGRKCWAEDAVAPLCIDREAVEPVWKKLAARAAALGLIAPASGAGLIDDPELCLVTEAGLRISPTLFDGRVYAFVVPGDAHALQLVSRSARPSETIGPFLDDRRSLGVQVGRIGISESHRRSVLKAHLTTARLAGWYAPEDDGACRWTNGNAVLPVDLTVYGGRPVYLDIEVLQAGPYRSMALAA